MNEIDLEELDKHCHSIPEKHGAFTLEFDCDTNLVLKKNPEWYFRGQKVSEKQYNQLCKLEIFS
jgi:hypothetical protein